MAEFNRFSIYGLGQQGTNLYQKDKVDRMVDEMIDLQMYNEVQDFVKKNFGDVEGTEWFKYPELNKSIYVSNEAEKIEICVLKNGKQYYGVGWKPIINK